MIPLYSLFQVHFEDIFAEPDSARSLDCVWKGSFFCFNCCKDVVYKVYTFLFGICIAMEWGLEFGVLAVEHIWFITPSLKFVEINCAVCKKLYGLCVHCCMDPCCEACGLIFTAFRK